MQMGLIPIGNIKHISVQEQKLVNYAQMHLPT